MELTLHEALMRYRREITPTKRGARAERHRIHQLQKHPITVMDIESVRGEHVAWYRDDRLRAGRSPITVRNDLIVLSHVYTIARTEWGYEQIVNPVSNIRKPKLPPGRDRRLVGDEERRLLAVATYPTRPLVVLAIETAMRLGELLSLHWECIDLKRCTARLATTKNGSPREVPLSTRAIATLRGLPRHLHGPVFALTSNAASHRFRKLCRHAGISGLRFHDLRHEATSRLFERGLNTMEVAAITGHKTLAMLQRYTHLRAEDLARKLQ